LASAALRAHEVSQNIGAVQEAATSNDALARGLLGAAGQLAASAAELDAEVDSFLAAVREA
jgi:methyl-accepting chemotaxis protein